MAATGWRVFFWTHSWNQQHMLSDSSFQRLSSVALAGLLPNNVRTVVFSVIEGKRAGYFSSTGSNMSEILKAAFRQTVAQEALRETGAMHTELYFLTCDVKLNRSTQDN